MSCINAINIPHFYSGRFTYLCIRSICSSAIRLNNKAKQAKMFQKFMGRNSKARKTWYKSNELPTLHSGSKSTITSGSCNFRRVNVLNKLFMRYITDIMGTGEIGNELLGRGLQISRVQIAANFNVIKIYWVAKGTDIDIEIEEILNRISGKLRHELSQLRLIGNVPPVIFLKDKQYANIAEVDRILTTADFGDDYVPIDAGDRLKSEFTLNLPLSPEVQKQIEALHDDDDDDYLVLQKPLPPMGMDVLGLKHGVIMNRIRAAVEKSQAVHRCYSNEQMISTESSGSENDAEKASQNLILRAKKEEFIKFLLKRKYMKKKSHFDQKNFTPEMEVYENEILENVKLGDSSVDEKYYEEDYEDDIDNIVEKYKA